MTNKELEDLFYRQTEHIRTDKSYAEYGKYKKYLRPEIVLIFVGLMETAYLITNHKKEKYHVWGLY